MHTMPPIENWAIFVGDEHEDLANIFSEKLIEVMKSNLEYPYKANP